MEEAAIARHGVVQAGQAYQVGWPREGHPALAAGRGGPNTEQLPPRPPVANIQVSMMACTVP
jgi:hypothetical protein